MANYKGRVQAILPGDPRFLGKVSPTGGVGATPAYQDEDDARIAELEQELARRGIATGQEQQAPMQATEQEQQPIGEQPQPMPDEDEARIAELEAEIAKRNPPMPNAAQNIAKGYLATGPAGMADMLLAGAHGGQELIRAIEEGIARRRPPNNQESIDSLQLPEVGSATKKASEVFHNLTGIPTPPEGSEPSGWETMGQFLSPVPGLSKIVNPVKHGIKAASKAAGRAAVESAGMAGALHELPNISEKGSALEDIAKTIIGGKAARGAIGLTKGIGKAIVSPKETLAKVAAYGTDPNIAALKLAEKHGIELPVNVGMRSGPLNWVSNALSNTIFSSNKYKNIMQRANDSMVKAVKKSTDRLGVKDIDVETASSTLKEFITAEEKVAKKIKQNAYDAATALLKEGDTVVPKHTAEVIDAMKEILERTIKSPETRATTVHVLKIAKDWGLIPKNIKLGKDFEALADNPASMRKVVAALKKTPNAVPVQSLEGVRTELGNILKHKQQVLGMEGWLQALKIAAGKDLDTAGNQAYRNARKNAHATYVEVYANRFKESIAKSMITGDAPLYAFEQLKNIKNLRILEKIAGESPKARAIVDALKKAKVREIFHKAITEEGIKTGNFAHIFESTEVKKGFLKELLGPESYKEMSDISKIMREMMDSGREILNTSKTSHVTADFKTLAKLKVEVSAALIGLWSGNYSMAFGAAASAATRIAVPNLMSRLLADPEFIKMARAFAMARKNGNMAYSGRLLENMGKRANDILKATTYNINKPEEEE